MYYTHQEHQTDLTSARFHKFLIAVLQWESMRLFFYILKYTGRNEIFIKNFDGTQLFMLVRRSNQH